MSKEYVEKEAAKAMIQSNADGHLITDEEAAWIIADIDSIDAADVAPVVRCKDCKYHTAYRCPNDNLHWTHNCTLGMEQMETTTTVQTETGENDGRLYKP